MEKYSLNPEWIEAMVARVARQEKVEAHELHKFVSLFGLYPDEERVIRYIAKELRLVDLLSGPSGVKCCDK